MQFKNAQAGVAKLFKAEILMIFAVLLLGVATVLTAIGGVNIFSGNATIEKFSVGLVIGVIALIVAVILFIIAFFFELFGLNKARKDESNFKDAFILFFIAVAAYIAQVIIGYISNVPDWVANTPQCVAWVSEIFLFYNVVRGSQKLLDKRGKTDIAQKGTMTLTLVIISIIFAIVTNIIVNAFVFALVLEVILAIISILCAIVGYIVYLVFLAQAKNNLA